MKCAGSVTFHAWFMTRWMAPNTAREDQSKVPNAIILTAPRASNSASMLDVTSASLPTPTWSWRNRRTLSRTPSVLTNMPAIDIVPRARKKISRNRRPWRPCASRHRVRNSVRPIAHFYQSPNDWRRRESVNPINETLLLPCQCSSHQNHLLLTDVHSKQAAGRTLSR